MSKKVWGILTLGATALYWFVLRCIKSFDFSIENFHIHSLQDGKVDFGYYLRIANPLIVGLQIDDIVGDVYMMGVPVARIDYPINQKIYARSISNIDVDFILSIEKVGKAVWRNIESGDLHNLDIVFDFRVKSGLVSVPVKLQYGYDDIF